MSMDAGFGIVIIPIAPASRNTFQLGDDVVEFIASRKLDVPVAGNPVATFEVDGYDLIRLIRQDNSGGPIGIPAIALTAYARAEDRMRALRAGYQAHIAKPVEPSELLAAIASFAGLVEGRRAR
jgi:CheY-like chemotaxis protein